jgi:Putative DNA-binding domain
MIVVDGRTDVEKLRELLLEPEQTHLDFKATLDLTANKDKLEFVKDAVSMANRPPGGYIIVGAHEGGTLALPTGSIQDRALFDGARLGDLIRKYTEGEVHPIVQFHDIEGHEVVLIHFPHHRDGLPVPMSTVGQYRDLSKGRDIIVFREGDVLVREGAKNTPLRHAHWADLLAVRDRRIRAEAREDIDSLLQDMAKALKLPTGKPLVPLSVDLSDDAFQEVVISHLEAENDIRLRQFLRQAQALASNPDKRLDALDKMTSVACLGLYFERPALTEVAINSLYNAYAGLIQADAEAQLDAINRAYVIGSLAVRTKNWATVHDLVLQPYPPTDDGYVYSSWIRHGQVKASRAGLFPKNRGGMMISAARALAAEHGSMRPDIPDDAVSIREELAHNDNLLNSLCQFDFLYVAVVAAEGRHHAKGYPACSAFHQHRVDPILNLVGSDPAVRSALFPHSDEATIATAIAQTFMLASRQSFNSGGGWGGWPAPMEQYVQAHGGEVKYPEDW